VFAVSAPGAQYNHQSPQARFRSVLVATFAAIVRVLDSCEIKYSSSMDALLQRRRAVATLPAGGVIAHSGHLSYCEIFAFRNEPSPRVSPWIALSRSCSRPGFTAL